MSLVWWSFLRSQVLFQRPSMMPKHSGQTQQWRTTATPKDLSSHVNSTLLCLAYKVLPPHHQQFPVVDQILLTLLKLRQNFVIADLARRFKSSPGQVSETLKFIAEHTKDLIPWLPRETIKATMPQVFQDNFSNTTCVIDCTESVFCNWSIRNGYVHYRGLWWEIGDADPGFTIRDLLEERNVSLVLPTFTRKQCQLRNEQVTRTQRIANVRIHVERARRRLKVYKILSQTVANSLVPKIDNRLKMCAALVNLRE
uniref:DDE Tnp4 domain-containing protein n=1 Tax=Salmo trutta TaxID=8032 RepID=A0A673Y3A8_SALTR